MPIELIDIALRQSPVNREPASSQVERFAKLLSVSLEASIVRLEVLGRVASGAHRRWLTALPRHQNPDKQPIRGGGGGTPQYKVKLAKFGYAFGEFFGKAAEEKRITDIGIYRLVGLKPKYQKSYFDFASSTDTIDVEA